MTNWKQKRTPIRAVRWTTREWRDLFLSLVTAFVAVVVGAAINFNQRIAAFFHPHANQMLVQFLIQFLVLWLVMLLIMSYLRWRKEALKNAELEDVVDSISPDVLLVVDPQRHILMASASVRRMFGHEPAEVINRKTDSLYGDRRSMSNVTHEVYDALEQEGFHIGWATGRRKNGRTFPLEIITGILKQHGGSVLLLRDITERKNAEHLLRQRETQLQQAQKMESVGLFAGGIAHNFNNILMGIMGYADLGRNELPAEHPARCYLDEIIEISQRSAGLIQQLLAFARKQTIAPAILDLNETLTSTIKLLRSLIGEDIAILWQPGADTWPVKMDLSQLDQILTNLALNARDAFTGAGTIVIGTGNATITPSYCADHPGVAPGDYVLLTFHDTGCGMDPTTLEHIFEPFFTTKGMGKGTGLGLSTVYGIVKQNAGFMDVCSEPGQGTKFNIYLPRCAVQDAAAHATEPRTALLRGNETILLVEDEKSVRVTIDSYLRDLGYNVLIAATPDEALRLAERHPAEIHLLITDVIMPGMSGCVLAQRLSEKHPAIERLFISGFTADVLALRGAPLDSANFLAKPFGRDLLAGKVRQILDA
jgi:PAS domain S-box-containing protein